MTVTEMRQRLEEMEKHGHALDRVLIYVSEPSVGYAPTVVIESITPGFDWDKGTVIIRSAQDIVKKRSGDE